MHRLLLVLIASALFACSPHETVSEEELNNYILDPQNGLRKVAEKNGVMIEAIYRPSDLVLAQQLRGLADSEERRKVRDDFKGFSYFLLKLSRRGQEVENMYAGDSEKFQRVVNYLSSTIWRNIHLVHNSDTIPALDGVYTRMFGTATATSMIVLFDCDLKKRGGGEVKFFLEDRELNLGSSEFTFNLSDIRNAPYLNLN